jgi:hypothetical protein
MEARRQPDTPPELTVETEMIRDAQSQALDRVRVLRRACPRRVQQRIDLGGMLVGSPPSGMPAI